LLEGTFKEGDTVMVDAQDGEIVFGHQEELVEPAAVVTAQVSVE